MNMVIVLDFHKWEEVFPVVLPLVNEELEKLFQLLIDSLYLFVSLGMIVAASLIPSN